MLLIQGGTQEAPLTRLFSAKHEFSNEWHRFLNDTATANKLEFSLLQDRFPFQFRGRTIELHGVRFFLKLKEGYAYADARPLSFDLSKESGPEFLKLDFKVLGSIIRELPYVKVFEKQVINLGTEKWSFQVDEPSTGANLPSWRHKVAINGGDRFRLNPVAIEDIWMVFHYSVT